MWSRRYCNVDTFLPIRLTYTEMLVTVCAGKCNVVSSVLQCGHVSSYTANICGNVGYCLCR